MREDGSAGLAPGGEGAALAAQWASDESRRGRKRVGTLIVVLGVVLLLGVFLAPNPSVTYGVGAGRSVGSSGWSGLIPPLPPSSEGFGTVMNWLTWLLAFLITGVGALCRFLTVVSVVWPSSPVPDALLYVALGAALWAWRSKAAAILLVIPSGAGFVMSVLRLAGVLTGSSGNVVVSLLVLVAAAKACQLTWS
jgi:hypothetical protein